MSVDKSGASASIYTVISVKRVSNERCRRDAEPLAQRTHLANVELALASQDFRYNALAANLREIALLEAVLLHQKLQGLYAGGLGQRVVLGFMGYVIEMGCCQACCRLSKQRVS